MAGQFSAASFECGACCLAEAAAASLICVCEGGPEVDRFEAAAVFRGARDQALGDGGGARAVRIGRGLVRPTLVSIILMTSNVSSRVLTPPGRTMKQSANLRSSRFRSAKSSPS